MRFLEVPPEGGPQISIELHPMKPILLIILSFIISIPLLLAGCVSGRQSSLSSTTTYTPFFTTVVPTPEANMATVTGIFKWTSDSGSKPGSAVILSLGKVLLNSQGTPSVAQLDTNTELRTLTDDNGRFIFTDVPPGGYVLVFDRIMDAFMLKDPQTGEDFIFEAKPGQLLDLGELVFDKIP
jgi:hypothetical protein